MGRRKQTPRPPNEKRSAKAGKPPAEMTLSPQARRRQKTASAAVRKDTMLSQAGRGPRVVWGVAKPNVKKR